MKNSAFREKILTWSGEKKMRLASNADGNNHFFKNHARATPPNPYITVESTIVIERTLDQPELARQYTSMVVSEQGKGERYEGYQADLGNVAVLMWAY